jgi:hypothetical protein
MFDNISRFGVNFCNYVLGFLIRRSLIEIFHIKSIGILIGRVFWSGSYCSIG